MSQALNGAKNRIEYLDYLRGVLMALGVVTHAAYVYSVDGGWRISDAGAQSVVFNWIIDFLHLFRLQSFFLLSGFLFSLSAVRNGVLPTFVKRASRIGIPLMVVLLVVNSVEVFVCENNYRASIGLAPLSVWDFEHNSWIGHLWFLVYLLGFHCAALVVGMVRDKTNLFPATAKDSLARYMVYVPLLAVGYELVVRTVCKMIPVLHANFIGLSALDWLLYLPFYAVGIIAGTNRLVGAELSKVRWQHFVMLTGSVAVLLYNPLSGMVNTIVDRAAHAVVVWSCCVLCFYSFERLCRFGGSLVGQIRKISEASYSIYLFHHIIVITLGLAITPLNWSVWAKFSFVLTLASVLSYALHQLVIRRVPLLAFLFNGVPFGEPAKKSAPRVEAAPVAPMVRAATAGGHMSFATTTTEPRVSGARSGR